MKHLWLGKQTLVKVGLGLGNKNTVVTVNIKVNVKCKSVTGFNFVSPASKIDSLHPHPSANLHLLLSASLHMGHIWAYTDMRYWHRMYEIYGHTVFFRDVGLLCLHARLLLLPEDLCCGGKGSMLAKKHQKSIATLQFFRLILLYMLAS